MPGFHTANGCSNICRQGFCLLKVVSVIRPEGGEAGRGGGVGVVSAEH